MKENTMKRDPMRPQSTNPTLDECREAAAAHVAYGWSSHPWGHWSDEQTNAYMDAYEAARAAPPVPTLGKRLWEIFETHR